MESKPEAANFGKSIIVPSVQQLAKQPLDKLPPRYVHADVVSSDDSSRESVPVIDLQGLVSGDEVELERLHRACKEWGFFQEGTVVYSEMSATTTWVALGLRCSEFIMRVDGGRLDDIEFKREVVDFFKLPWEEKKKLWQQPDNHEGFGQLFVVSEEQKLDWSDMFFITTLPSSLRRTQLFDLLPLNLREMLESYSLELRKLAMTILGQMAKGLKMDSEEMRELFRDGVQTMRLNYYPPCPEPEMAIGFSPHSDAVALTILYQLNDISGLQIRKEGKWVPVKLLQKAFVVNVGDIMKIVSNGVYRSIEHRATMNSTEARLSIATFYSSNLYSEFGPAHSLVGPDNPAVFRRMLTEEYFKEFFARKLNGKSYVDFMKKESVEGYSY